MSSMPWLQVPLMCSSLEVLYTTHLELAPKTRMDTRVGDETLLVCDVKKCAMCDA